MIVSLKDISPYFPESDKPTNIIAMPFRPIVMNAVEYVVFPGAVNKDTRYKPLLLIISDHDLKILLQNASVGGD